MHTELYSTYLIGRFSEWCRGMFLQVSPYFGELGWQVKIQETSKKACHDTTTKLSNERFAIQLRWKIEEF